MLSSSCEHAALKVLSLLKLCRSLEVVSPSMLSRARSCVVHGAVSLSKLCRSRSSVVVEALSLSTLCELSSWEVLLRNRAIQPLNFRWRIFCNNSSPLARRPLTQPRSSPSDQHIASRTQAVDSARVPNRKFASKKKATMEFLQQVVLRSVLRPSRRMPAPVGFID